MVCVDFGIVHTTSWEHILMFYLNKFSHRFIFFSVYVFFSRSFHVVLFYGHQKSFSEEFKTVILSVPQKSTHRPDWWKNRPFDWERKKKKREKENKRPNKRKKIAPKQTNNNKIDLLHLTVRLHATVKLNANEVFITPLLRRGIYILVTVVEPFARHMN